MVVGFVLTPFVVRQLGASQYGLYSLAIALIPYITLLDLGMGRSVTRYIAQYRAQHASGEEAQFLATALRIYILVVAILIAMGTLLYLHAGEIWGSHFTANELSELQRIIIILTLSYAIILPGNALTSICNGMGLFSFPRGVELAKYIVRTLSIVALLLFDGKALALIALESGLNIVVVIITYLYVKRHIGRPRIAARKALPAQPIIRYSLWMALYGATFAFQWYSGQVVAGMTHNTSLVGVMSIGIMLGNIYSYFAETINRMTMPHASRLLQHATSPEEINRSMVAMGRIISILLMGILGGFIIFGDLFITMWVGESYLDAYYISVIMMAAWSIDLCQDYGKTLLQAKGKVKRMSIINFITIFAGAIFSYFAAQQWGLIGIIGSLAAGTLAATIANNYYYHHELGIDIKNYFSKVFTRSVANMGVCVAIFVIGKRHLQESLSPWIILIGVIAYIALYALFTYKCVLTPSERGLLIDGIMNRSKENE